MKGEDLSGCEPALVSEELWQIADPAAGLQVADRLPKEPAFAGAWCD